MIESPYQIFQEAKEHLPCNDCPRKENCLSVIFGCNKLESFSRQLYEDKKRVSS